MRARVLMGLLATLFGAVLPACSPVTQLLVVVRSDLPAERIASVDVEVRAFPSTEPALMRTLRVGASGEVVLPFSFGVVPPRGDVRRRVQITVSARAEDGSVSVTRVVRTGFGEGLTLAVPVFLSASCAAVACTGESTCIDGVCESPDIDVGELEPVRPGDELAPRDAAVRDTGGSSTPDASVDAGSGTGELGFPRPTRVSAARDFAVDVIVREILPNTSSGDVVVVLDVRPNTILFGGTEPISPLPTTLVARLDGISSTGQPPRVSTTRRCRLCPVLSTRESILIRETPHAMLRMRSTPLCTSFMR